MSEQPKHLLQDEQGSWSMARTLLLCQLIYVDVAASVAAVTLNVILSTQWWAYQSTIAVGLIAWAAGPRGLQYIGSRIGQVTAAVGSISSRFAGTDRRREDDERGEPA